MKSLLLCVVAIFAALALGEMALRIVDVARPLELPPQPTRPEMFAPDPNVGYHLWPSTRTCMRYPPNSHRMVHVVSNSDGFASSRELGDADPRPRVLVLGDSFVFGTGVNEGSRFTEVVEEIEPRWRVDNLGMPGWGVDLMIRGFDQYGAKARPKVAVLAVYTDDFRRVEPLYAGVGYPFTKFTLEDGKLVDTAFPQRTPWQRLRLAELVRRAVGGRDRSYFALNEALIDRFQAISRRIGAVPVILFLPAVSDTEVDRERRTRLANWAERRGILFRDLTRPIHDAGVKEAFLSGNWHWSELGHRIAGQELHALLAASALLGEAPAVDPASRSASPWRASAWQYCHDGSLPAK